jgi:hypothetical protein
MSLGTQNTSPVISALGSPGPVRAPSALGVGGWCWLGHRLPIGWCYWDYPIVPIGLYVVVGLLIGAYTQLPFRLCGSVASSRLTRLRASLLELPGRPHGHCPECQLHWLSSLRQQLPCCLPQLLLARAAAFKGARRTKSICTTCARLAAPNKRVHCRVKRWGFSSLPQGAAAGRGGAAG